MREFKDLSGVKFGKLLVIERIDDYVQPSGKRRVRYLCVCGCGKKCIVRKDHLLSGRTVSCGCRKGDGKCFYLPYGVDCSGNRECEKCGWNPNNKELHDRRIANIKRKDGTDE